MVNEQTVRGWVAGRVQGVGFRASFARQAQRLSLQGWVRNLPDARVEFLVSGSPPAVQQMLDWCHTGPRFANVEQVFSEAVEIAVPPGFEIRY